MPSERVIRITHTVLFTLLTLAAIPALGISASLVAHYNNEGYPPVNTTPYRDRIRICLAASIWTTFIGLVLSVGFQAFGTTALFGLLSHLIPLAIAFILFIIGAGSLTGLTNGLDCSQAGQTFDKCSLVKGLVVISWIDTIFVFLALVFVTILCFMARGRAGVRASNLYLE